MKLQGHTGMKWDLRRSGLLEVAQASAEEKFLSSTQEEVTWWHLGTAASDHGDEYLEGKTLKATYWKDKDVSSALISSQKACVCLLVEYYEVLKGKKKDL